jgi:glucose-6-phosphate 1-dehydrogenase
MFTKNMLPQKLAVIGVGRSELADAEFRKKILFAVTTYGKASSDKEKNEESIELEKKEFEEFYQKFSYVSGSLEDTMTYQALANRVYEIEATFSVNSKSQVNKLFYFAVPPDLYTSTFRNLAKVKLNLPGKNAKKNWTRVLLEKPIGGDLKSAKKLVADLKKYYKENQIYLMDHYFYKDTLDEIENERDRNNWSNKTVEGIEIVTNEKMHVYERGAFYDSVGALIDVGQNHLLAVLATLAIKKLNGLENNSVKMLHKQRADVLKTLKKWTPKSLQENTFRAQHDGYTNINGVAKNSIKETYFRIKTELTNAKWKGVPIYLEAGKSLGELRKQVVLSFKDGSKKIFDFEASAKDKPKLHYVSEYYKILSDVMGEGDKKKFVSAEEVFASWKFVDPVVNAWRKGVVKLEKYKEGTTPVTDIR